MFQLADEKLQIFEQQAAPDSSDAVGKSFHTHKHLSMEAIVSRYPLTIR